VSLCPLGCSRQVHSCGRQWPRFKSTSSCRTRCRRRGRISKQLPLPCRWLFPLRPANRFHGQYCGAPAVTKPKGAYTSSAALKASALQDLVDVLPDIIKVAAGVPLQFQLCVTLGDGQEIASETVAAINKLLEEVSSDLLLIT